MTKRTPGPWVLFDHRNIGNGCAIRYDDGSKWVTIAQSLGYEDAAFIVEACNSVSSLREALALIAGGFEGEGLEIENEWRRSVARNALNGVPLSEHDVLEARAALNGVTQPASPWTPEMKWAAMDIDQAVCDLVETMREIEKQCVQADDPEHHTLSLVKHMARNALKRLSQPSTEVENSREVAMTEEQIKHMVDRFLSWKLPESFNPDGGISFEKTFNEHTSYPSKHEPYGTNLFNFDEATAMVRHMLEGLPATEVDADQDLDPRTPKFGVAP